MKISDCKMNVKALITAVYMSAVWMIHIYVNVTTKDAARNVWALLSFMILLLLFSYAASTLLFKKLDEIVIKKCNGADRKSKIRVFTLASAITFVVMLIWFVGHYPGSFSPDSISQYGQAITGKYNDWHPVLHTLLFFTLPLKMTGHVASIIVFQILYFSLTMGYLALTLYEMYGTKVSVVSCMYILLNPCVGYIMMFPWKDVAFAMGGALCTIISIRFIVLKEKADLRKIALLGLLLACTTIFRHNAILYTGPLIAALFFNMDRRSWVKTAIIFAAALFVIKVPLYHSLDVTKPGGRVIETVGLPLTIIGNVAQKTPERMDEELANFVYSIAPHEKWATDYLTGDFNNIKYAGIDMRIVEKTGRAGMLRLMAKCFKLSPKVSCEALFALTDMVYGFETTSKGNIRGIGIVDNPYGLRSGQMSFSSNMLTLAIMGTAYIYSGFVDTTFFGYLRTYGVVLFVILVCALCSLNFRSWASWKKTFLVLPIFMYDFGTMLFLMGWDSRFFFITFLAAPLIIGYTLYNKENV
ncbi:MAG: glycosyltransferase family 39 protein [Synergistes sp.]|nr:glycosyltransferase family 39 protein [Synergistes sp.]